MGRKLYLGLIGTLVTSACFAWADVPTAVLPPLKPEVATPPSAAPVEAPTAVPVEVTSDDPRVAEMLTWKLPHGGYMMRMRQRIIDADKAGNKALSARVLDVYEPIALKYKLDVPDASKRHKVSKDTLMSRIAAAGKLADAQTIYASQSDVEKFAWDSYQWFWSDNQQIIGFSQVLGLDPKVILAVDPQMTIP